MNTVSIDLEGSLSSQRLRHSRAVAHTATLLNHTYTLGLDDQDLVIAGLYHDLAREWSASKLVAYAQDHQLAVTADELAHPVLLHGPVASHLVQATGANEAILLAIRHHTLGSVEMGRLGLLIYLADYLEPNRTHITEEVRNRLLSVHSIETLTIAIIEEKREWRDNPLLEPTMTLYRRLKEGLVL